MRRTKQDAEQTREAILDAAERVFFERGVARASLEAVARRAGVTRGAVYWHFRDKPDLFMALNDRLNLPHEALAERISDPEADPIAELEEVIASVWQSFDADERSRRLLTILFQRCDYVDEMAPAVERQLRTDLLLQSRLLGVFERAASRRPLAWPWCPDSAARVCFALIRGSVLSWLRGSGEARLVTEALPAARTLLASIRGPGPANTSR